MVCSRRSPARALTILLLVSAIGVFAVAFPGCGSSGGEETESGGTAGSHRADPGPEPPPSGLGSAKQLQKKTDQEQKAGENGRSTGSAHRMESRNADGSHGGGQSQQGGGHRNTGDEDSVCPGGMTRAECKKRIEAETTGAQEPGKVVSDPSDCTEVMSEEQCEEIVRAQKAAEKQAGKSVSPQTCLEEYSREFCEERFGEQAEQQQAGR